MAVYKWFENLNPLDADLNFKMNPVQEFHKNDESFKWLKKPLPITKTIVMNHYYWYESLPSLDVSSSLCTTDTLFAVAGEDAGLAMPPTGPTLDAPDPTLLWCESAWSTMDVHLLAGESLPPSGDDVDACWWVSNALSCEQIANGVNWYCMNRAQIFGRTKNRICRLSQK